MRPQIAVYLDQSDDIDVRWTPAVTYPGTMSINVGGRVNVYIDDRRQAYALALDIMSALKASEQDEHKPTHVEMHPVSENYGSNVLDLDLPGAL